MANTQIIQSPFKYVTGLQLSWATATTLTVAPGETRDSTDVADLSVASALTINGAVNGANGLDTGSLANATWYYVFIIGDSTLTNSSVAIISASATPLLPSGYDVYRRIGWVLTNGSAQFLLFRQTGSDSTRKYAWDAMISVLANGVATAFTAVTLTGGVPPMATRVGLYAAMTPNTASNSADFRPTGSAATTVLSISGVVAAEEQKMQIELNALLDSSVAKIDYKVANASDSLDLSVLSFEDYL